ncbi:SulP family inorganic anion transporter [Sphingomonas lycopersici]|uniref:SulP family inorganic anion transporter n=1 Tax=Sphingomonas lycopersici TaxID=2951807 RepID=A0AA41ZEZ6_9SPHN|nr:SulP family inorganic anion transporter [Sphingomonas lycopersici]MCW6529353.1 SulP family inorganic anion transporter [Sphingomonas lycopersici]MCW6535674.1 SulP family inorganic anion transporter [Sphingomonas lycopersici]
MARADVIAGVSVAGLLLPEAVAYASIAGLEPARAIVAAIAGCLAYAAIGRSRFAIVSPTSSSAAILAAALAAMAHEAVPREILATLAVALAGLLFLIAAALRLGALTSFIARPVLRGFALGLAITIILRQLPAIVGVDIAGGNLLTLVARLAETMPDWHLASVATGLVALALLLGLRRLPGIPAAFVVLVLGIAASRLLDLTAHGVRTVGDIAIALHLPELPDIGFGAVSRLAQLVVPLALILFAESWGTMRALALRHGDSIDPDRELAAIGGANLAAAVVQGMPVGAGFSAGSASEAAGAASRWTPVFAAVTLGLLAWFGRPAIAHLPDAVLAAVVIAALTHALSPAPFLHLWRIRRDEVVAFAAAAAVLAFGVLDGMLIAIALSLAALIQRMSTSNVLELGQLGGGHDFVDLARHPDAKPVAGILVLRPSEPLFFGNAERVLRDVERRLGGGHALVLSIEESFDLDSTALDCLIEFDDKISRAGTSLRLARVHDHIRDLFHRAGRDDLAARSSYSVADAVAAISGDKGK